MNEIYLRRRMRLHVRPGAWRATPQQLATVQKELEPLGFVLTEAVRDRLATLEPDELARTLRALLKDLRPLVGAHRDHVPLYPGFPAQVLALTEAELYLNAIDHYLSLRRLPAGEQNPDRPPLLSGRQPRLIELGSVEDFETICTRLAGSASSLSAQDKDDLGWFIRQYRADVFRLLPGKFPCKENLALVGAQLLVHVGEDARTLALIESHFRTATDVLRLAVCLSDGDASLAKATRFGRFPRRQRRLLLELLERCGNSAEDMRRWAEPWKRLGERLHPGEYAKACPQAAAAFAVLRNGLSLETFNGQIEQALSRGDVQAAAQALESRPGEYARRLDVLLRKAVSPQALAKRFEALAARVSTPVLLQVLAHFGARSGERPLRVFFPKGDAAKVFATPDRREPIDAAAVAHVVQACEAALLERFARLPPLGTCYVDPALARYVVPLAQRSASKSLRTIARGSRMPMPEADFVRLFLWWMNGRSRVDIDLSAAMFGTDYQHLDTIAFYNLRGWGAYHSGDIVDAPKGAAEFIDLDLQMLRARGARFVVMCVSSYSGQSYCDLPECFAGWMARADLRSGEAFDARTVVDRVDLASDTRFSLPLVLDLQQRELLWADFALRDHPRFANSVHSNLSGVSLMLRALECMVKPNLHTLMSLHARSRGQLVACRAQAQTRFGTERDDSLTPFDGDAIRSQFLQ